MNPIVIIILFLLANVIPAFSQSWDYIKTNREYIYGEGKGVTVAEADNEALNDLISKISIHVSASVTTNDSWSTNNAKTEATSEFSNVFSTYSQATLNNTEKVIIKNEPDAVVGRWIRRADIEKIFEARKFKIKEYVSSAERAEQSGKIDVALKDFYWALELLKSLQDPSELTYETEAGRQVMLQTWIPQQMNEIFKNLTATVTKRDGDDVELMIKYKKIPVNSLDYTYFDGRDWSNIYSAKDGVGVLELAPGNQSASYQMKIEYEYRGESHVDREVESVLKVVAGSPMRSAYLSVKSKVEDFRKVGLEKDGEMATFAKEQNEKSNKPKEFDGSPQQVDMIDKILKSIVSKSYSGVEDYFTPYGWDIYQRLIKYGKARIVGLPQIKFYKSKDCITARGVQMSFSFATGIRKSFVEDIVFTINSNDKIDNISFGLGKTAEDNILGHVWDDDAKFSIISFLENYQTAYALKRLDYIETIFDDDAVIITGSVVKSPAKRISGDMNGIQFTNDIIKYNRHTKDSYLKQLKQSFASKEFINIRFADNEVRKLGKGGFAIQISQEYYSSNYGDKGYLFLMVDMDDANHPVIKVRTWQPEKDPDFGLYGPGDFN